MCCNAMSCFVLFCVVAFCIVLYLFAGLLPPRKWVIYFEVFLRVASYSVLLFAMLLKTDSYYPLRTQEHSVFFRVVRYSVLSCFVRSCSLLKFYILCSGIAPDCETDNIGIIICLRHRNIIYTVLFCVVMFCSIVRCVVLQCDVVFCRAGLLPPLKQTMICCELRCVKVKCPDC